MRIFAIFALMFLVLGCISLEGRDNVTEDNITADNVTGPIQENQTVVGSAQWERYTAPPFSFEYPANMKTQESRGIFTGTHDLDGQTAEIVVVVYMDTISVYGLNQDKVFKGNPTKAASDFLLEDMEADPAQLLSEAYEIGNITTFSIVRDAYVSEIPFRARFSATGPSYQGYALSLYVPERSLHIKFRVVALDSETADDIKDKFISSFRIE